MSKLAQERKARILEILHEEGMVSVTELTEKLDTSESTIRRDLLELDKLGKLNRVHGGATMTERQFVLSEDDIREKIQKNVEEKRAIAELAARQITDDDFVYLDAGTTTLLMLDYITASKAQFVTNGIVHARTLISKGFKTYVLGGELKATTEAVVGLATAQNLEHYNFSKAFIGTNGIHTKYGFTTPDVDEGFLKTAAMERSFVNYVVADSSKFGKVSTITFGRLEEAAIITDRLPDQAYIDKTVIKAVGEKTMGPARGTDGEEFK